VTTLAITQVKSSNGSNARQRDTLRSLGLRRVGHTVERADSPQLRGMVHAVRHLIVVAERDLDDRAVRHRRRRRQRAGVMADEPTPPQEAPEEIGLHSLAPAKGAKRDRRRIGRGHGSGHGKTSGRGHKGYGARSGSKVRPRFEGGQNPIHMRMRKLRGPNKKMSMPFEPFRTHTQPVNLDALEARFASGAAVDLAALRAAGLATRKDVPVKVLGRGELSKPLTVHAHKFSRTARAAIEAAGGTCVQE